MLEFGLILLSLIFFASGYKHIKNHSALAGYTTSVFGACPFAKQFGYLGGWATGVTLLATAAALVFQYTIGLSVAIGFLAVTQVLFHRDLKDPANQKHLALIGALVALLAYAG